MSLLSHWGYSDTKVFSVFFVVYSHTHIVKRLAVKWSKIELSTQSVFELQSFGLFCLPDLWLEASLSLKHNGARAEVFLTFFLIAECRRTRSLLLSRVLSYIWRALPRARQCCQECVYSTGLSVKLLVGQVGPTGQLFHKCCKAARVITVHSLVVLLNFAARLRWIVGNRGRTQWFIFDSQALVERISKCMT